MALIVEDGSIVANANSYLSLVDAQSIVDNLGYTATLTEANVLRGMAMLNMLHWCGYRVEPETQPLPWPRVQMFYPDGRGIGSTTIPPELKTALAVLAYEINAGNDPASVTGQGAVKREKVDVIEVEYADGKAKSNDFNILQIPLVKGNLDAFICSWGLGHTSRIDRA